jgi:hypothetical protein
LQKYLEDKGYRVEWSRLSIIHYNSWK